MDKDLDHPTEITEKDIDAIMEKFTNGDFDIKKRDCFRCGKSHFPNYGHHLDECDECFFSRFPKEQREQFFRSFLE